MVLLHASASVNLLAFGNATMKAPIASRQTTGGVPSVMAAEPHRRSESGLGETATMYSGTSRQQTRAGFGTGQYSTINTNRITAAQLRTLQSQ
jgi:hypothetical protein